MTYPIDVIGLGADGPAGLRPELRERVHNADFLAGGERHLRFFPDARGERFVLRDEVGGLVSQLTARRDRQRCVVLASGDPLFYGIGRTLTEHFPPESLRIEPALSSMQLAFARAGLPWQDAALASVHGRDLRATLLPLLGRPFIGLFTRDGDSPAEVAEFFLRFGLGDCTAVVAENLGTAEEQLRRFAPLTELIGKRFSPLNYLIIHGKMLLLWDWRRQWAPGIPDDQFCLPAEGLEVITRQEVRAVALAKLLGPTEPGAVAWDIGAGLGTVSVEIALQRPDLEVVAVERDPNRAALLRSNRHHFRACNVRVVEGEAPAALDGEPLAPSLVFLGGSGGRLSEILGLVRRRLRPRGVLVATFVTLEHLAEMLTTVRQWKWPCEVTELHVSRSDRLAGLTGMKPQRGVFIVRALKAGDGE